jgi:hypothetical protein
MLCDIQTRTADQSPPPTIPLPLPRHQRQPHPHQRPNPNRVPSVTASKGATISCLNTDSNRLQTHNNLVRSYWTEYGGNISLNNGSNSVTISPAVGNLFSG